MPDVIVPYEGGKVVISEQAQQASKAAEELTTAFPELVQAQRKGVNNLDVESQGNLNELRRQMRASPPKPATVINFHPWPLTFGATNRFLRGITIPACEPGMPYAFHHIRGYRADWQYTENAALVFKPILPIHLAAEFVREFSNVANDGGGVLIYEGEGHPDKVGMVETYDPIGRLLTKPQEGVEYDEEDRPVKVLLDVPIKRQLSQLIEEQRDQRNRRYMQKVQAADREYRRPDGKGKSACGPKELLMADVLFAEHLIAKVPEWDLKGRMEEGLADTNCKSCGGMPRDGAYKCSCGHILDPLAAYMDSAIEYGHVAMEMMTADEWVLIEEEKARRDQNRTEAKSRIAGGKGKKDKA